MIDKIICGALLILICPILGQAYTYLEIKNHSTTDNFTVKAPHLSPSTVELKKSWTHKSTHLKFSTKNCNDKTGVITIKSSNQSKFCEANYSAKCKKGCSFLCGPDWSDIKFTSVKSSGVTCKTKGITLTIE